MGRLHRSSHVAVLFAGNTITTESPGATFRMILGDLPPNSRVTLFRLPAADCWMIFPTFCIDKKRRCVLNDSSSVTKIISELVFNYLSRTGEGHLMEN